MKISFNWLKEFIEIPYTPERVAEILTDTGLEVEGIEKIESVKGGLTGVVVGEVISCDKHPDADKLNITEVFIGSDKLQIVCGASNVAVGQKVLVATVGCTLYPSPEEPFTIKKAKIRGVESNGMICAEDELGLGNDHNGIMVLPKDTSPGLPAAEFFKFSDDFIFEIGLTPNRSDAMGHIGVARDLAAYLSFHNKTQIKVKNHQPKLLVDKHATSNLHVDIVDPNCHRYMGVRISGVTISPSPEWLQQKLRSLGVSPINNVVDITNYVMRELGTPLHAFDASILGEKVVVRPAEPNEKLVTLDKVERSFKGGEMLICDEKSPVCIAGVMGGLHSGVSEKTCDIFLEAAVFDMVAVRKTARLHGINSDSSFRFERGVDRTLTELAIHRAGSLILDIAGGTLSSPLIDKQTTEFEEKVVDITPEDINSLLGTSISDKELEDILCSLDFKIEKKNTKWVVNVPLYRIDVVRPCDIAEEVLRIYGFNNVAIPERMHMSIQTRNGIDQEDVRSTISEFLVANGFLEAMNNSLTKGIYFQEIEFLQKEKASAVKLLNPLSQDLDYLRASLIPGLLENIAYNQNRQAVDLKFFEFGKSYKEISGKYIEESWLTLAITGRKNEENWINDSKLTDFYFVKGIVEKILVRMGLAAKTIFKPTEDNIFSEGLTGSIYKKDLIKIGQVAEDIQEYFGIKKPVFIVEINWKKFLQTLETVTIAYTELPKSFVVRRDFSLLLGKEINFSEIEHISRKIDSQLLKNVNLFDVYEGEKLEKDKKSYAVSFHFQHSEKTLTDNEIDSIMGKIRKALEQELGAQLR